MSETPVRKVPETNDPASAPPRPSASPQHQQQIPAQHQQQQQEHRADQRQDPRQDQRQERRQDERQEHRADVRQDERQTERQNDREERRTAEARQQDSRQESRQEQRLEQRPAGRLEDEWQAVQYEFVDDPKAAVRKADDLVTRAIEELTTRHRSLAKQLEGNGDPQTEDLRLALHRYRELFKSLVATK